MLLEGVPGLAKTLTVKTRRRRARRLVQAPAVHARPRAGGPRRHAHLPAGHRRLRHRARPGVLQLPARRRDQPRARQGAVGAARGDAGAPGHDRPRHAPRAGAVPRARDAEPDRVRGHLPAARGAGRPLHVQARGRLPDAPRRGRGGRALARDGAPRSARCSRPRRSRATSAPRTRCTSTGASWSTRSRSPPRRAIRGEENWVEFGASPRGSINLVHAGRALALLRGRDYVLPSTCATSRATCCATGIVLTYEALAAGVDADRVLDDVLEGCRCRASSSPTTSGARSAGSGNVAEVSFREPLLLLALALVPLAMAAYVLAQRRRKKFALRYTNVAVLASVAGRSWGRHVPGAARPAGAGRAAGRARRPERTVAAPAARRRTW